MDNIKDIKIKRAERPPFSQNRRPKHNLGCRSVISIIILSLFCGMIGGAGGMIILSSRGQGFLKKLGIKENVSIPTTETRKLKLEESSAITDAVEKVKPAVVSIIAEEQVTDIFGLTHLQKAGGSGFIITSDGLIITNKHVVSEKNWKYQVYLNDGTKYQAKVISRDSFNDLAVLKIKAKNLPVVELGSSEDLLVGQYIIAIGNALGEFQNTVTVGVVSAKERKIEASSGQGGQAENLEGLLQVDAAINRGNSGGPLINLAGQVVGINVAMAEGAENIGFAIPVEVVKSANDSLKKYGKIVRPYLGIRYVSLTPETAAANHLKVNYGALIYSGQANALAVIPGSPAARAGLKTNDIIIKINSKKIDSTHSLARLLQQYHPGDRITLTYLRDNKEQEAEVTLARNDQF